MLCSILCTDMYMYTYALIATRILYKTIFFVLLKYPSHSLLALFVTVDDVEAVKDVLLAGVVLYPQCSVYCCFSLFPSFFIFIRSNIKLEDVK